MKNAKIYLIVLWLNVRENSRVTLLYNAKNIYQLEKPKDKYNKNSGGDLKCLSSFNLY